MRLTGEQRRWLWTEVKQAHSGDLKQVFKFKVRGLKTSSILAEYTSTSLCICLEMETFFKIGFYKIYTNWMKRQWVEFILHILKYFSWLLTLSLSCSLPCMCTCLFIFWIVLQFIEEQLLKFSLIHWETLTDSLCFPLYNGSNWWDHSWSSICLCHSMIPSEEDFCVLAVPPLPPGASTPWKGQEDLMNVSNVEKKRQDIPFLLSILR